MKKLTLSLLLSLALGSASAQTTASTNSIGADGRLSNANVSINVGTYGGPLSSLLAAVAHSAGYEVIFDTNVDAAPAAVNAGAAAATGTPTAPATSPVVYNFANTPFNQVWPLLMDTYGLSYEVLKVGDKSVLRVGTTPIQKIVKLNNSNAQDVLNQVKLSFGTPVYTDTPLKGSDGQTAGTTRTLSDVKLDSPTLRIVADTRSNSLIVRGTNREVSEVEQAIAQVDAISPTLSEQNGRKVYSVLSDPSDIQKVLNAQYPLLKVDLVGQTKQLILSGDPKTVDAAITLLGQIDKTVANGPEIQQKIFQLVNASAVNVKSVLENTLARNLTASPVDQNQAQRDLNSQVSTATASGLTPTQARQALAQNGVTATNVASAASTTTPTADTTAATIIADQRTNTLIVRGTAQQVAQIAEIIPNLDQKVPQVNVQVRIQEITDTAQRALGVDWRVGLGRFNIGIAPNGTGNSSLTGTFDPTKSLVSGLNILPTLTAMEAQGSTKRVYDGSITLQSGQRNVANTSVTQNSSAGAAATIHSGGTLELNIPGSGGSESIQKTFPYGVTLGFYDPQVAPDGTITVRVRGDITAEPTDLTNLNLLKLTNSMAESTITFKDGQTVLLTGLLGSDHTNNKSGVPFLSSIPVIGAAIGRQNYTNRDVQMMVVITGTVIK